VVIPAESKRFSSLSLVHGDGAPLNPFSYWMPGYVLAARALQIAVRVHAAVLHQLVRTSEFIAASLRSRWSLLWSGTETRKVTAHAIRVHRNSTHQMMLGLPSTMNLPATPENWVSINGATIQVMAPV